MRLRWVPVLLLLLGACGDPGAVGPRSGGTPSPGTRYVGTGTVLQNAEHGPQLCLGAVAESFPPQCGGIPLLEWNWAEVGREQRAGGTTWGVYRVVGTFDGTNFTVTEPPGPPQPDQSSGADISTPCREPAGGWKADDPGRASDDELQAVHRYGQGQSDFGGLWIHDPNPPRSDGYQDLSKVVLNVAFTGDLERHEADLRRVWGGALCVTRHTHTLAELERIMNELTSRLKPDFGLEMLTADGDEQHDVVAIHVVFADADDQAAIDARYGKGTVKLTSALKPV